MEQNTMAFKNRSAAEPKTGSEMLAAAGGIAVILVAYALSVCLVLFWNPPFLVFVQTALFLVVGILHMYMIRRGLHFQFFWGEWVYTLAAAAFTLALLVTTRWWGPRLPLSFSLACACSFLLPFFVSEIWLSQLYVAYRGAKIWYPTEELAGDYPSFYFKSTPIRFRIIQEKGEPDVNITFKVSNEFPLGKIFYDLAWHKVNKSERLVRLFNRWNQPYSWVFFTPDMLVLNRTLDPAKNLAQNGLHENAVVYAQKLLENDVLAIEQYSTESLPT